MATSSEEKKVGIPESITINGVTYLVKDTPELLQFMQEVAKVEKSKLYTQFESLKQQINSLGKVKIVGEESPEKGFDVDAFVEKLRGTFIAKEDLEGLLKETVKEVVQPVLAATEKTRLDEIAQYRESIIADNISTCIPEMVKGETREELDASLAESIRIRSMYPSPSTVPTDGKPVVDPLIQQQLQQYAPTTPPATPTHGGEAAAQGIPATPRRMSPEPTGPKNIKEMPMTEFASQRDRLAQELKTLYGQ